MFLPVATATFNFVLMFYCGSDLKLSIVYNVKAIILVFRDESFFVSFKSISIGFHHISQDES